MLCEKNKKICKIIALVSLLAVVFFAGINVFNNITAASVEGIELTIFNGEYNAENNKISCDIIIGNTGNVTLKDPILTFHDEIGDWTYDPSGYSTALLSSGASINVTASRAPNPGELVAGKATVQANVTITIDGTGSAISADSGTLEILLLDPDLDPDLDLNLGLAMSEESISTDNEVSCKFTITNNEAEDVAIYDLDLADTNANGTWALEWDDEDDEDDTPGGPPEALSPGESVDVVASRSINSDDLDPENGNGEITINATIDAEGPGGRKPTSVPKTFSIDVTPEIGLVMNAPRVEGGTISCPCIITNTGKVTLENLSLEFDDGEDWDLLWGEDDDIDPPESLLPGDYVSIRASRAPTQEELDAAAANLSAKATADVDGTTYTVEDSASVIPLKLTQSPAITLTKTGDPSHYAGAGTISCDFVVKNTGNVTLNDISLWFSGETADTQVLDWGTWPGTEGTLPPGESVAVTASLDVTQDELDAGEAIMTTGSSGKTTVTNTKVSSDELEFDITLTQNPAITLAASAGAHDVDNNEISCTYTIRNAGNVTLGDFNLAFDAGTWTLSDNISEKTLAPHATLTVAASRTPTQAELDAGEVSVIARSSGKTTVTKISTVDSEDASDDITITLTQNPAITLTKTGSSRNAETNEVSCTFVMENTGNVTLENPYLRVDGDNYDDWEIDLLSMPETLAPKDPLTVTATRKTEVTSAELDVEKVSVAGGAVTGGKVVGKDTVVSASVEAFDIEWDPLPTVELDVEWTKSLVDKNNKINFKFILTNYDPEALLVDDIKLEFDDGREWDWAIDELDGLASGNSITVEASRAIDNADLEEGEINVSVTATGRVKKLSGELNYVERDADLQFSLDPEIFLSEKDGWEHNTETDTISGEFEILNTGNLTLSNLKLDMGEGDWTWTLTWDEENDPPTSLAPDPELDNPIIVKATRNKGVTQAELDQGEIIVNAKITGMVIGTTYTVEDSEEVTITLEQNPEIELALTKENGIGNKSVLCGYTITNKGNVTLKGVSLKFDIDEGWTPLEGESGSEVTLLPNEAISGSAERKINLSEANDKGEIKITAQATASKLYEGGNPVNATEPQEITAYVSGITYKNYDAGDITDLKNEYTDFKFYIEGNQLTLPENVPYDFEGYEFLGLWDCPLDKGKKDSEGNLDFTIGEKIEIIPESSEDDITVYARFSSSIFDESVNNNENYIYSPKGVFPNDSSATIEILEPGTEKYNLALEHVDEKDIEHIKPVIFEVMDSNGNIIQPNTFFGLITLGFEVPENYDENDLKAIWIVYNGPDVEYEKKLWTDPETSKLYTEILTDHLTPFALIDILTAEEKDALNIDDYFAALGDNQIFKITVLVVVALLAALFYIYFRKRARKK